MVDVIDLKVNNYYELHLTLPSGRKVTRIVQLRGATFEGLCHEDDLINIDFIVLPSNGSAR